MAHHISSLAEADLDDIWYYIATQSGSVEAAIDSLTRRFLLIAIIYTLVAHAMRTLELAPEALRWAITS